MEGCDRAVLFSENHFRRPAKFNIEGRAFRTSSIFVHRLRTGYPAMHTW